MTIPIGMFMGMWMYVWRKGRIAEATVIGVIAMLLAVAGGEPLNHPDSWLGSFFHLSRTQIVIALCVYGFIASVLPVWLLLAPRGYLSSFTKIGTILLLAFGVMIVNPELKMPALHRVRRRRRADHPGPLFPFCFITIACGAISGFHALISSGTTSKMVDKETDIRPIGYGAMLVEGVVGIMALIAATAMPPADYFAINVAAGGLRAADVPGRAAAARQPGADRGGGRREGRRADRRRGVAGRRHGDDLQRPARHVGPARLLVPLRDHVRGALHPDDHRLGHTRRALPHPGGARQGLRAVRAAPTGCPGPSSPPR